MTDADTSDSGLDEAKLARALTLGLPVVTVTAAVAVGFVTGLATALLVLIGGALIGVIAILWGSLRVLSGDAPLPPELEALDRSAQGVDALASRKKMLVRALKDLDNERALGKLEDADFEPIAATYRAELKEVLRAIDATLEPHRAKAEALARSHLAKVGLAEGAPPAEESERDVAAEPSPERRTCPTCSASNEPDAKFCKECATSLLPKTTEETTDEA